MRSSSTGWDHLIKFLSDSFSVIVNFANELVWSWANLCKAVSNILLDKTWSDGTSIVWVECGLWVVFGWCEDAESPDEWLSGVGVQDWDVGGDGGLLNSKAVMLWNDIKMEKTIVMFMIVCCIPLPWRNQLHNCRLSVRFALGVDTWPKQVTQDRWAGWWWMMVGEVDQRWCGWKY